MNLMKLWLRLSEGERETITFAARHCRPVPLPDARYLSLDYAIALLRECNRVSHGHGREALAIVEKLIRLAELEAD
jgi:hypothetical protein